MAVMYHKAKKVKLKKVVRSNDFCTMWYILLSGNSCISESFLKALHSIISPFLCNYYWILWHLNNFNETHFFLWKANAFFNKQNCQKSSPKAILHYDNGCFCSNKKTKAFWGKQKTIWIRVAVFLSGAQKNIFSYFYSTQSPL